VTDLPLHGVQETLLDPEPEDATIALAEAPQAEAGASLRAIVSDYPTFLAGWAALSDQSLADGDPVAAYGFARTGYHRGLDRIRAAGWRGQGPVPWWHEPNRGFLASVAALMRAADAIGEADEARRCREFLLQLDPEDAQGVRDLSF
jgi:uncharacterized protein DUF3151